MAGKLGKDIEATRNGKAKLDASAKKMLTNRQILAVILHDFVPEYRECTINDISEKYIEPGSIKMGSVQVEPDALSIEGISNEDASITEGRVTYDVLFNAVYPAKENRNELIGMFINVEAQAKYHPGYRLEKRGIYYAARRISSQIKSVDDKTNYGNLKKVYSIWICMGDVPRKDAGTVSMYSFKKQDLYGEIAQNESVYDLMSVIMIRVNDREDMQEPVLDMLRSLFSTRNTKDDCIKKLEQCGIELNEGTRKGLDHMCNFSDYVYNTGYEAGVTSGEARGEAKGEARGILGAIDLLREEGAGEEDIRVRIMKKYSLTSEQAVNYMNQKVMA